MGTTPLTSIPPAPTADLVDSGPLAHLLPHATGSLAGASPPMVDTPRHREVQVVCECSDSGKGSVKPLGVVPTEDVAGVDCFEQGLTDPLVP
jgi:hypothetical protein